MPNYSVRFLLNTTVVFVCLPLPTRKQDSGGRGRVSLAPGSISSTWNTGAQEVCIFTTYL